jgi:hypothetical protein
MNYRKVIDKKLLAVGLMLFLVCGCASTRGGAGVEWGSKEPVHDQDVSVAHNEGPPPHAPANGYRAKHYYRYYPASEVYYHTGRRVYFYIEADIWVSDALLPYQIRASLGNYTTVEMYSETPYRYHEKKYKKHYKAPPGHTKKNGSWVKNRSYATEP